MLMKLTLSSDKLCMLLSVAQIFDDQPELSHAVTERDLIVSEIQTFRHPPLEQLADNDGKGPSRLLPLLLTPHTQIAE